MSTKTRSGLCASQADAFEAALGVDYFVAGRGQQLAHQQSVDWVVLDMKDARHGRPAYHLETHCVDLTNCVFSGLACENGSRYLDSRLAWYTALCEACAPDRRLEREFMSDKLLAEFPETTYEQWREQVDKDLKGGDFQKRLVTRTLEG
jgi:hypothetical protein